MGASKDLPALQIVKSKYPLKIIGAKRRSPATATWSIFSREAQSLMERDIRFS